MADRRTDLALLLDVDGTLLDTVYLHVAAWRAGFRDRGYDVPAARIHRSIGMGGDKLVPYLIGHEDESVQTAWARRFAPSLQELSMLPGARDLVLGAAERGVRVVLASSAPADHAEAYVKELDVGDALHAVTTSADAGESKPAPDIVAVALERAGVPASNALMVGDAVWDVESAARAGLGCLAVRTGGVSDCELRDAGALSVHEDAADVLAHLDDALARLPTP